MSNSHDVKIVSSELYFIPATLRVPLKFGNQVLTDITCARAHITVENAKGERADGWGETPLSVGWVWPSSLAFDLRNDVMIDFSKRINTVIADCDINGHPMEISQAFQKDQLETLHHEINVGKEGDHAFPHLGALVCFSLFDIAIHDAYGKLNKVDCFKTYNKKYMNRDLSSYLTPAADTDVSFDGLYPEDFMTTRLDQLPVWHLVGGLDPLDKSELTGDEPNDGYPVLLRDWIKTDKLNCLKVKLRGNDAQWDYDRLVKIGEISIEENVDWLTTDFNCMVTDVAYVNNILDRLVLEHPRIHGMILYVEQPFPYDLEKNKIDVHSVSARKPLFMDESAHDWQFVKLGRELGWTGVALKTCKTLTGAILSMCWAKAHGMTLMVQDLTNPMLAQIPHVQLAAYSGTIMGVECNAMQFYPETSKAEAVVHPGLYERRNGVLDLSSIQGTGLGYREDEIKRELPAPA